MSYNVQLADKIRLYLSERPHLAVEEKKMFSGLAFLVNGKMCVNVSGMNLMCRFDPALQEEVAGKMGHFPMVMKGKYLTGYCYVAPIGFSAEEDFRYWINLCLDYNQKAKASRKSRAGAKRSSH